MKVPVRIDLNPIDDLSNHIKEPCKEIPRVCEMLGFGKDSTKKASSLEELNELQLKNLVQSLHDQILDVMVEISRLLNDDQLNTYVTSRTIEDIFGLMIGQIILVDQVWVKNQTKDSSDVAHAHKVANKFVSMIGNTFVDVLKDVTSTNSETLNEIKAQMKALISGESNEGLKNLNSAISEAGETGFSQPTIGHEYISLAVGVGPTLQRIGSTFYEFGHKKCTESTVIPGTILGVAAGFSSLTLGQIEKMDEEYIAREESRKERYKAYERRKKIESSNNEGPKEEPSNLRSGLVIVYMDNGTSHFNNFYDEEDLTEHAKSELMDQMSQIMLQKHVHVRLNCFKLLVF